MDAPRDENSMPRGDTADGDRDLSLRFTRCLDGEAGDEELGEIEELLRRDAAAREEYVATSRTAGSLFERFEGGKERNEAPAVWAGRKAVFGLAGLAGTLAAAFAGVLISQGVIGPRDQAGGDRVAANPAEVGVEAADWPPEAIARLVSKIDCVLRDEAWTVHSQPLFYAGQTIRLERGFLELELRNGITVVLEGPAAYTLASLEGGVLDHGGMAVRVPEGSEGYVVDTPSSRLVDMGTEFAVKVDSSGATSLHVLDGEVEASERRGGIVDPKTRSLIVEDARWSTAEKKAAKDGAPASDFLEADLLSPPPCEVKRHLPVREGLALWLAADMAVRVDDESRVVTWGDGSSSEPAERESAWQVDPVRRPLYVPDGIDGLPAIRFDGRDDCLVTEPLHTGEDQTIFVVCRQLRKRVIGVMPRSQLISYNGPPTLMIEHRWPTRELTARVFAGYQKSPVKSGAIDGPTVEPGELFAIGYVYSHTNNRAELYVNGESHGMAEAAVSVATSNPRVIGMHRRLEEGGFGGDMAELVIFDRALDPDEITAIFDGFAERYARLGLVPNG